MTTVKLELNDLEVEILKNALNKQCAYLISESVDITKDDNGKKVFESLYKDACRLRNKIYDEIYVN